MVLHAVCHAVYTMEWSSRLFAGLTLTMRKFIPSILEKYYLVVYHVLLCTNILVWVVLGFRLAFVIFQ